MNNPAMNAAWFRYTYRVPWLLLHAVTGVLIGLAALNPLGRRLWWGALPPEELLVPWWSRVQLRIFGITVKVSGTPVPEPALFAANHVSWADIVVLHSQRQMAFVAKREIRFWPVVGWLAARAGTVFHRRGSPASLARVSRRMSRVLARGGSVALFPEGRVGDGTRVLPFHGRLFKCALDNAAPVQPVALRYRDADGAINSHAPFRAGEPFVASLLRLMGRRHTVAELYFCEPMATGGGERRRDLAIRARQRIIETLDATVAGPEQTTGGYNHATPNE